MKVLTTKEETQLVSLYMSGETLRDLLRRFAVSYPVARSAIVKHLGPNTPNGTPHRLRKRALAAEEMELPNVRGAKGLHVAALLASEPNLTQADVSRRAGVSRERVRQVVELLREAGFDPGEPEARKNGRSRVRGARGLLTGILARSWSESLSATTLEELKRAHALLGEGGES